MVLEKICTLIVFNPTLCHTIITTTHGPPRWELSDDRRAKAAADVMARPGLAGGAGGRGWPGNGESAAVGGAWLSLGRALADLFLIIVFSGRPSLFYMHESAGASSHSKQTT